MKKISSQSQIQNLIQQNYYEQESFLNLKGIKQWKQILLYQNSNEIQWSQLGGIDFGQCLISNEDLQFMAQNGRKWKNLQVLNLWDNKIKGGNGLKYFGFGSNNTMVNLTELRLTNNCLGNQGVRIIANINMPLIKVLTMQKCQIKNQGLKSLLKMQCPNLVYLNISQNNINLQQNSQFFSIIPLKQQFLQFYIFQQQNINNQPLLIYKLLVCCLQATKISYIDNQNNNQSSLKFNQSVDQILGMRIGLDDDVLY